MNDSVHELKRTSSDDHLSGDLWRIRSRIVDSTLIIFTLLIFPSIAVITLRAFELGWRPSYIFQVALYFGLLVPTSIFRGRLTFFARTSIVLFCAFTVGVSATLGSGLMSAGPIMFVFICVMATVLFGKKWGYYSVLICTLPIFLIGITVVTGDLSFNISSESYSVAPLNWVMRVVFFAGLSIAIVNGSAMLYNNLLESISSLSKKSQDLIATNNRLNDEITERKRTQLDLQESEQRYRILSENVTDVVSIQDMNLATIYVSPSVFEQRGFTPEEIKSLDIETLVTPEALKNLKSASQKAIEEFKAGQIASNKSSGLIFEAYCKDGSTVWLERVASILADKSGQPMRFIGVTRDISVRKRMQEEKKMLEEKMVQMQKMESLGLLAGGIAHDFNNMLVSMMGNTELAQQELGRPEKAEQHLDQVLKATERASELCRQLLAYSGKGKFVIEPLDVGEQINELKQLLQVSIPKIITLETHLSEEPYMVKADASQLQQVIMNLVINASEAIGDETGVIAINVERQDCDEAYLRSLMPNRELKPGRYIKIEVTDNGKGMDTETMERIFDPFYTSKDMGYGLGLSGVLGIVNAHEGVITVTSEPGEGSVFRILLPAMEEFDLSTLSSVRPKNTKTEGNEAILVVDDDVSIRETTKAILTKYGYSVLVAKNGYDAAGLYKKCSSEIDLVLLDLSMPGIGGEETYRQLQLVDPDVRVIFSSGFNEEELKSNFDDEEIIRFIQKPYRIADLLNIVTDALH